MKVNQFLFARIDNSPLVVFRVFFGLLIMLEAWGAIATGWVRRIFVEPEFTFNFIGFDFFQIVPGTGPHMYAYFILMGIFGAMVMLGYRYRLAIIGYAIMWSVVYLMQKSAYNNHYYLLMLLLWIMTLFPAHTSFSLDAKRNPSLRDESMPRWVPLFIIAQLWIVYTYASIAKLYPDWLDGTAPQLLMSGRKNTWLIGDFLQLSWVPWVVAYVGILFDGLIIPALLWKKTRKWAFIISIFFHLFNSVVFQIGIFPYMSLAFTLFFYPTEYIHCLFLKRRKPFYEAIQEVRVPKFRTLGLVVIGVYIISQIVLPSRHWLIEDHVLWSEEGHRLSWRMMLRTKSGSSHFTILDKATNKKTAVNLKDYLSKKQLRNIGTKPDFIWQFAQYLKKEYAAKGQDISVFVNARVRINGRKSQKFIDPKVDLAAVSWDPWDHATWILDSGDYLEKE